MKGTQLHIGTGAVRRPFPRPVLGPQRPVLDSAAQLCVEFRFHCVLFFLGHAGVEAPLDIGLEGVGPLGAGGKFPIARLRLAPFPNLSLGHPARAHRSLVGGHTTGGPVRGPGDQGDRGVGNRVEGRGRGVEDTGEEGGVLEGGLVVDVLVGLGGEGGTGHHWCSGLGGRGAGDQAGRSGGGDSGGRGTDGGGHGRDRHVGSADSG